MKINGAEGILLILISIPLMLIGGGILYATINEGSFMNIGLGALPTILGIGLVYTSFQDINEKENHINKIRKGVPY